MYVSLQVKKCKGKTIEQAERFSDPHIYNNLGKIFLMKKVLWWLLILACAFLLLIMLIVGMGWLIFPEDNGMGSLTTLEKGMIIGVFTLIIAVLLFGLIKGINNLKKKTNNLGSKNSIEIIPYQKQLDISASGQIAYKDYRNLIASISLKRRFVVYFIIIMVLIATNIYNSNVRDGKPGIVNFAFISGFLLVIVLIVFSTALQIKKQYKSNKILNERLTYHLTNEQLEMTGETVNSILKWGHFYKMKETTNFYLFYHGNNAAVLIDKQMFAPADLAELSEFLKSLKIEHV
jgi:hypothetical protein